jgi:nucleoid-associated protein YgaU
MLSRKDVKIGVAIGGILLAVVFVYMLSSPGNKGVELAKTDTSDQSNRELTDANAPAAAVPADADASHDSSHGTDSGDAAHSAGKTPDNSSLNGQTQGGGAAPAPVSASGGATAVPATPPGASDPWETALRTGKVPALMTSTPTPTAALGSDAATAMPPGSAAPANAATGNVVPAPSPDSAKADSGKADAGKSMMPGGSSDSPTTQPAALARGDNAQGATVHVVEMNETYCTIARSTWGRASLYQKLIEANPGIDPRHLRPGMKINIPALKLASAAPAPSGNANESSPERSQGDGIAPGEANGEAAGGGVITPNPAGAASAHHETPAGSAAAAATPAPVIPVAPPPVVARSEVSADVSTNGLSSDGTTYTVQSGDSLYKIAKRLYGTGNGVVKIYNANKDVIGPNMAKLSVGMVLKLPEAPTKLAKAS